MLQWLNVVAAIWHSVIRLWDSVSSFCLLSVVCLLYTAPFLRLLCLCCCVSNRGILQVARGYIEARFQDLQKDREIECKRTLDSAALAKSASHMNTHFQTADIITSKKPTSLNQQIMARNTQRCQDVRLIQKPTPPRGGLAGDNSHPGLHHCTANN